jgi:hypothetical protein
MKMGTRADFYVGRGKEAEWLGSTAWDGYRDGIELTAPEKSRRMGIEFPVHNEFQKGAHLFDSKTEQEFRERVAAYFANRDDATLPEQGWPWPWETSATTDCSYWFFDGRVWDAQRFRGVDVYAPCDEKEPKEDAGEDRRTWLEGSPVIHYPDMSARKNVTLGKRSGVIVLGG